ncbi:unnamed protein product [Rhizoctonia solani]|uniref:C2H2-type domain-containing protein n=1 Tax=Rhizoctonia solani TaxID=456999 RepID=A0A8H3A4E3_9AGAM|nr:unnamed protein product [Rhizoctonia solani]
MASSVIRGLVSSPVPSFVSDGEYAKNSKNNEGESDSSTDSWSEYGDHEVWVCARNMLGGFAISIDIQLCLLKSNTTADLPQADAHNPQRGSEKLTMEGGKTILVKGFVLDQPMADLLLERKVYFIHFPSLYCFDKNRIICRIGEGHTYHQVTTIQPNPPEPLTVFDIGGLEYCFDNTNVLWVKLGENWLMESTYPNLSSALSELVQYIEANNLHIAPGPSYVSPNSTSSPDTVSESGIHSASTDNSEEEEHLSPLSPNPDQPEIDNWVDDMKLYRALRMKEGIRLEPIHCPLSTCRKIQRRPQALRDHLYFHFSIKPHYCDYGCPIAFETEANKNRHHETCAAARGSG